MREDAAIDALLLDALAFNWSSDCFGSQADLSTDITPMTVSGAKPATRY